MRDENIYFLKSSGQQGFFLANANGERKKFLAEVTIDPGALQHASEELRKDREIVLAAVQQNGRALEYANRDLKNNRDVVLAAVGQNGQALQYASKELRAVQEVVLVAVQQDGLALQDADDKLKADREVVLAAVSQNGSALKYANRDLKNNRDVVLAAVGQNGLALQYADDKLKADREVVLAAVQQDGLALQYADDKLKADREVVLAALDQRYNPQHESALQYASKELQADREVVLEAVKKDPGALQYASKELQEDPKLVIEALLSLIQFEEKTKERTPETRKANKRNRSQLNDAGREKHELLQTLKKLAKDGHNYKNIVEILPEYYNKGDDKIKHFLHCLGSILSLEIEGKEPSQKEGSQGSSAKGVFQFNPAAAIFKTKRTLGALLGRYGTPSNAPSSPEIESPESPFLE